MEEEIKTIARTRGLRLIGANCLGILRPGKSDLCCGNNVMPQSVQEAEGDRINVLVGQELHGVVEK